MSAATGSRPTSTISRAGSAAVSYSDSAVDCQTATASVSPPSGRSSSVAGSSFITSVNTSRAAVSIAPEIIGTCTRASTSSRSEPSPRAASSSERGTRSSPASTDW